MWNYCSMLFIKTDTFAGVLHLATLKGQMFLLVMWKNFLLFFPTVLREDLCCFSDLLPSCLHPQIHPGFVFEGFRQSSAPQSSPGKLKGGSEYLSVRKQPLDVLSVAPIVYDKSTEEKHRDPDSLCFRRVGLRSVLIRPTAAFDSIVNPVRLLGSKPRGLKHRESTSGMVWHAAELSRCTTCEETARAGSNPQLWFVISFWLRAAGPSNLGE